MTPTNDAPVTVEQLWCLHVMGPDEVHPAPDRATAQLWATQWTVYWHRQHPAPRLHDPVMSWIVAEWPHDAASHADSLAKSIADNTWPIDPLAALASAPAGDGVEAKGIRAAREIAAHLDTLPATYVTTTVLVSQLRSMIAALARPRAAVGEREA